MKKLLFIIIGVIAHNLLSAQCQNCGVGTNNPKSKLEVRGCGNDSTTSTFRASRGVDSAIVLYTRDDRRVGINTANPYTTLQVETTGSGGINIANFTGSTSASPSVAFMVNSSVTPTFKMGVDASDSKFKIGTAALTTNVRMAIDGSGNVGIGQVSPANKLDVNGTAQMTGFKMTTSPVSGYVLTSDASGNGTWTNTSSSAWSLLGNAGTTAGTNYIGTSDGIDLVFKTAATERMRIGSTGSSAGNVGIGNTSPTYRLEVQATPASSGTQTLARIYNNFTATNNNGAQLLLSDNRTTSGLTDAAGISGLITDITNTAYKGALILSTANNAAPAERMRIDNAGNVGIGTTSPGSLLDVNGSVRGAYNTSTASYFGQSGVGYCGQTGSAFFYYSNSSTDYALLQTTSNTYLNAASGFSIILRVGNTNYGGLTTGGLALGLNNTAPGTNDKLDMLNGHIRSQQTTAPTGSATAGTGNTIGFTSIGTGSSDTKGIINLSGSNAGTNNSTATVTFNLSYGAAPTVVITPANAAAQGCTYYVTPSTTNLVITFKGGGTAPSFYYYAIE